MANTTAMYPIVPPPLGVKSNFIDPPSQLNGHIVLNVIFLTLSTICLGMRLYTRKFVQRKLALDDYVIVCGYDVRGFFGYEQLPILYVLVKLGSGCCVRRWDIYQSIWALVLFSVAFSALNLQADAKGMARHGWDFPFSRSNWIAAFKPFIIGTFTYILGAATVKLSCLLFYRHIFSSSHKTSRFINAGIIFISVSYTAMFLSAMFECIPIQKLWDFSIQTGHCSDPRIQTYTNAGLNTFTDIYVLVVPLPAVFGLPLSPGRKFRVLAVFGLGLCACITSIVRISLMLTLFQGIDVTWNFSKVSIWSVIELNVGIICSCLLVFPAFLKRHLPPGFGPAVARLLPCCFGRAADYSTTKTYMSGSAFSHSNRSDESSLEPPDLVSRSLVESDQAPGHTTLITSENIHDLEAQPGKGPHSG